MEEYLKTEPEDVNSVTPPLMFISFPSTKDPTYNARFPGKSTCAVITATPYEWFSKWRDEPVLHRGMEYEMIKKSLVNKMTAQVSTSGSTQFPRVGCGLFLLKYMLYEFFCGC